MRSASSVPDTVPAALTPFNCFFGQRRILAWLGFPPTDSARRTLQKIVYPAINAQRLLALRPRLASAEVGHRLGHAPRVNPNVLRMAAESLEALVDFLFDAVQPIFDCDRVGVSFLEEDGARLAAHHGRAAYEPVLLGKGYAEATPGGSAFTVWNEGPGFPAAQRARLFRKFSRLDTPELMKRKGTGVGLYTSWRIVSLPGGRIDASSEEGSWAEFRVQLPAAGQSAQA